MSTVTLDLAGNAAVASLGKRIAKLDSFVHDYASDYSAVGNVVKMPIIACSAGTFDDVSCNYEQNTGTNEASITLSSQYVAGFAVSGKQLTDGLGAWNNLFKTMGDNAARAISRSIESAVVGQVLSSTNTPVSLTTTKAGFAALYKSAYDNDLDPSNTVLVLNPETYGKLIETVNMDVVGMSKAAETGIIDNFLGFKRIVCSDAVDTALKGFMAEDSAIGIVGRRIPMLDGFPQYAEYQDESTGIPLTLVGHQRYSDGKYFITVTGLWGTDIVDAAHVVPLV